MLNSFARKLLFGALCTAASTVAASANSIPTYNVQLVNPGSTAVVAPSITIAGSTLSNVYIGPYTIAVDGYDLPAMCMNFNILSTVGSTYNAYATQVGSTDLSATYAPADGQEYEEEAYLYSQLTAPGVSSTARTNIQEAAWDIMSYGITNSSYVSTLNSTSASLKTNTNTAGVEAYINAALTNYSGYANIGYYIISDTTAKGEQEFLTAVNPGTPSVPTSTSVTPEPSSFALMLAPALLFGAEMMRRRKQTASLLS